MSQYELYAEAGPSSQITLSHAGIPPPSSVYSIGIIDEPLTPDHSISQQPIYSGPESSILQTEPNPIPPNLRRIGPKHQKFWVLWTTMNKTDFIEWWRHTAGAHPHPPLHKVNFEARYTSAAWEHFDQVAHFQTGKPMALCRRCGKALSHPSSTLNGSKSLAAHLSSRACIVASKKASTQQDIQQSLELTVLYTSDSTFYRFNTNIYITFSLLVRLPERSLTNSDLKEPKSSL